MHHHGRLLTQRGGDKNEVALSDGRDDQALLGAEVLVAQLLVPATTNGFSFIFFCPDELEFTLPLKVTRIGNFESD